MSSSWGPARVTSLKWKSLILEGDWQIRMANELKIINDASKDKVSHWTDIDPQHSQNGFDNYITKYSSKRELKYKLLVKFFVLIMRKMKLILTDCTLGTFTNHFPTTWDFSWASTLFKSSFLYERFFIQLFADRISWRPQ